MQGGFLRLEFGDQLFCPINGDLIEDGALDVTIALNLPVDLVALLAHLPQPRRQAGANRATCNPDY